MARTRTRLPLLFALSVLAASALGLTACRPTEEEQPAQSAPQAAREAGGAITLATTTSTYDSGLLDVLIPTFEAQSGYTVKVVAVGTGQALALGRNGDADILLTHAPKQEAEFVDGGYALKRYPLMYNDFVIVGPPDDPAGLAKLPSAAEAMAAISTARATFVSRGDDSGTHMKEKAVWEAASVVPEGDWYLEAGAGMADVLRLAEEKQAYTLSDRSTFLAHRLELTLAILFEGDKALHNPYAVMPVSPERYPDVSAEGATALLDFFFSEKGKKAIAVFGEDTYGQPLFYLIGDE